MRYGAAFRASRPDHDTVLRRLSPLVRLRHVQLRPANRFSVASVLDKLNTEPTEPLRDLCGESLREHGEDRVVSAAHAVLIHLLRGSMRICRVVAISLLIAPRCFAAPQTPNNKPPLTLDQFFSVVSIGPVRISPDGRYVAIQTTRADWAKSIFRKDIWLYREEGAGHGSLIPLTQSEGDFNPEWSPDGRWIAFLSTRELKPAGPESSQTPSHIPQLYVIRVDGGEAIRLTGGPEPVHCFAWSADSRRIFYATRIPWTKRQQDAYKREWDDTIQYRKSERGDLIRNVQVPSAISPPAPVPQPGQGMGKSEAQGLKEVARTPYRVKQLAASPDGRWLALLTEPPSLRIDDLTAYGIYLVNLPASAPQVLVRRQAIPEGVQWSPDSRRVFFSVKMGSVEGRYEDAQPRAYSVNVSGASITRWAAKFPGAVNGYAVSEGGGLVANGRIGTQVQVYSQRRPAAAFTIEKGWPGTYGQLSAALHSSGLAFVYSTLQQPDEVYLADSPQALTQARRITSFNESFTQYALPRGRPFRWKADDGTTIEGMLVYPPGKFEVTHLPMFTFIHGGPEDADGDHFEADWYQWAALAATQDWLVFEPNYRGSTGYGDRFVLQIVPDIVSRPGKDILEGIDALVRQGIANPNDLTVGGYSYGGYMTDWLITQNTRFKAAVTGAGAIENAANWGNDDMSFDDAYMLDGTPWQAEGNYNREAALWQMNKVTTPTHIVAGGNDIRVYVGEDYLLERSLHALGIPHTLLIFPGEGHSLSNNPWHGKIKVREELKWLGKYGRRQAESGSRRQKAEGSHQ
jgi:dipeptidyl aminopeptidase/acylaminoacyl peptidase